MKPYEPGWQWNPEICPADQHFIEWMESNNYFDKTILHMGTGAHHRVGIELGNHNSILGLTLSPDEILSYTELVTQDEIIAGNYKVLFSDAHNLNPALLPSFDIITLFHLGEIYEPSTLSYSLEELVNMLRGKLKQGGFMLAYTKSGSWKQVMPIFDSILFRDETYKTLQVYT